MPARAAEGTLGVSQPSVLARRQPSLSDGRRSRRRARRLLRQEFLPLRVWMRGWGAGAQSETGQKAQDALRKRSGRISSPQRTFVFVRGQPSHSPLPASREGLGVRAFVAGRPLQKVAPARTKRLPTAGGPLFLGIKVRRTKRRLPSARTPPRPSPFAKEEGDARRRGALEWLPR